MATIPGVTHAGIINSMNASTNVSVVEHPPLPPELQRPTQMNQVSPDYFAAMGIPLRAGRTFTDRDVKAAPRVVVIDDSLARREFPNESPTASTSASEQLVGDRRCCGARYWGLC